MKSGNLNFLEPSGPPRPVTGLLYLFIMCYPDHLESKHVAVRITEDRVGTYYQNCNLKGYSDRLTQAFVHAPPPPNMLPVGAVRYVEYAYQAALWICLSTRTLCLLSSVSATLRDLDSDVTTYVSDTHTCLAVIHRAADSQVCGYDSESVLEYLL
jgi:hypothetical protein